MTARLHMVGSGTPTPTKERHGSCYVLELDGEFLMFDCGPAATHKMVKCGLWPTKIEHLFVTHHHFDHFVDYPCFLLVRWDQSIGKEQTLKVFGPPGTKMITDRLIGPQGAFVSDWTARISHPGSRSVFVHRGGTLPRPAPNVQVTDIGAGVVLKTDRWTVTAEVARHQEPWLNSLAYRVDAPGLSILFPGDTDASDRIRAIAKGCDVILSNTWDTQQAMETMGDEAIGLTNPLQAASMAKESGAKMLILTHTGPHLCGEGPRAQTIAEMAKVFKGKIIFGEELTTIDLQ